MCFFYIILSRQKDLDSCVLFFTSFLLKGNENVCVVFFGEKGEKLGYVLRKFFFEVKLFIILFVIIFCYYFLLFLQFYFNEINILDIIVIIGDGEMQYRV